MWWLLLFHFCWLPLLLVQLPIVARSEMFRVILCSRWDSCIKMFDQINHDDGLILVNALI